MPSYDQANELEAPVEQVFAAFKNIRDWPAWVSVLSAAEPLSTGPLRVGFRLEMTPTDLGRPVKTALLEYEENRVLAWGLRSRVASATGRPPLGERRSLAWRGNVSRWARG